MPEFPSPAGRPPAVSHGDLLGPPVTTALPLDLLDAPVYAPR